jgi:[amino group carrier protein]-lysine/ornithine hydrolase
MDDGDLLVRLLSHYSPSGDESAAVGEFVRVARELGYDARADAVGNGIAVRGRGRPELMFLGHIDTVDGERPVRRTGGRVHGRGAVDAKGAIAAALLAGRGFAGPGTFRVIAAVGEETDSRGARRIVRGRRPDAVIAGEPSGWDGVTTGYKGDLRIEATFCGERSHYAGRAPTAGDRAFAWLSETRGRLGPGDPASPFRSVSAKVVGLHGEFVGDRELARITLDVRIPPGLSIADVRARLGEVGAGPAIRELVRIEPFESSRSDPVVAALAGGIRAEGGRPTLWHKTGTSDLNLAARAWKVPGAAYGPGDARLDHTPRESLSVAELGRAARVLRHALDALSVDPRLPSPRRSAAGA